LKYLILAKIRVNVKSKVKNITNKMSYFLYLDFNVLIEYDHFFGLNSNI